MESSKFNWIFIIVGMLIVFLLIIFLTPQEELNRIIKQNPVKTITTAAEYKDSNIMCINDVLTADSVSFDVKISYFGETLSQDDYDSIDNYFRIIMSETVTIKNNSSLLTDIYNALDLFFVPEVNDIKHISISVISLKSNHIIHVSNSCEIKDKIFDFYFTKDRQNDFGMRSGNKL